MSTSKEVIDQYLGRSSSPRTHSEICQCTMCMKSKLEEKSVTEHEHGLKASIVDRKNPDNPGPSLMKAQVAHAIIKANSSVDMMEVTGLNLKDIPDRSTFSLFISQPNEVTVGAKWKKYREEPAVSGKTASVFGGLGVLLIPPNFKAIDIPVNDARAVTPRFLKKYGAELIPLDEKVHIDSVQHPELETLYLVQYDFDKDYIDQYVMNIKGGGGLFVETHPFPHVFTPLAKECRGALILGLDKGDGQFDFAAFNIPFGYTLKIASNVIHGDSFFIGPYAIALTETELADSVIFKQETPTRDIQKVVQTPSRPCILPLLTEYGLAKAINHQLMIEKIRGEGPEGKNRAFFERLPSDVLKQVKDISLVAEETFRERVAKMSYPELQALFRSAEADNENEIEEIDELDEGYESDPRSSPPLSQGNKSTVTKSANELINTTKKYKESASSLKPKTLHNTQKTGPGGNKD